jgi:hypothetical protein
MQHPEKQAIFLVNEFRFVLIQSEAIINESTEILTAKQCATLAVNLLVKQSINSKNINYWNSVKAEINKL